MGAATRARNLLDYRGHAAGDSKGISRTAKVSEESMKVTSADILEYESLRGLLGRYVSSPLGKAELAKIAPHTDAQVLTEELAEAAEAVGFLRSAAQPQPGAR